MRLFLRSECRIHQKYQFGTFRPRVKFLFYFCLFNMEWPIYESEFESSLNFPHNNTKIVKWTTVSGIERYCMVKITINSTYSVFCLNWALPNCDHRRHIHRQLVLNTCLFGMLWNTNELMLTKNNWIETNMGFYLLHQKSSVNTNMIHYFSTPNQYLIKFWLPMNLIKHTPLIFHTFFFPCRLLFPDSQSIRSQLCHWDSTWTFFKCYFGSWGRCILYTKAFNVLQGFIDNQFTVCE
jgi:hypothetical protein